MNGMCNQAMSTNIYEVCIRYHNYSPPKKLPWSLVLTPFTSNVYKHVERLNLQIALE